MADALVLRDRLRRLAVAVAAVEPLFLLAALPCLIVLPLRFAPVGLGLMAVAWLARWLATGRLSVRTPADWPLALFVLMIPVTLYATALPEITWQALTYLAAGLATFNTVTNWTACGRNEKRLWLVAWGLVGMGTALALLAPVGVKWSQTKMFFIPPSIYRAMPLLLWDPINSNIMAGALVLILPLPLALLLLGGKEVGETLPRRLRLGWAARPALVVAWLLMAAILVLTQSRGSYVATAIAATILLALWRPWMSLAFLVMAEAAALAWNRLGLADWLFSASAIRGWQAREQIWSRALTIIHDFPFTGIGMGTINQVTSALYPLFWDGSNVMVGHAHNLFLQIGVDLGLPGLIAYLALWLTAMFSAWRACRSLRREGRLALSALAAGLGASLVALAVHGLFDAVTWGNRPAFLAWALLGLAVALPGAFDRGWPTGAYEEDVL
jgi:putative inorganic carbon (HCO3(-)) transporter